MHRLIRGLATEKSVADAVEEARDGKLPLQEVTEHGLKYTLMELGEKDLQLVCELIAALVTSGHGTTQDVRTGLDHINSELDELRMDCPKAPEYLQSVQTFLSTLPATTGPS